jgi:hypothetical protein
MNGKFWLLGREQVQGGFKALVDRQMRKQRRDERQLAEQRTTRRQFEARNSCAADARSYRMAREFPMSAAVQLDWKTLNPARWPNIFRRAWLKKFREDQLKHWLTAKQAS